VTKFIYVIAVILAGIAVAVADAIIKKVATKDVWSAFKDPWMIAIILLYITQVVFFMYVFGKGLELGLVGNMQMAFYSITTVLLGLFVFGESLSWVQITGIGVSLAGIIMMNWTG
jgi:multidrug transporter EmrE-like cation transporter